MTQSVGEGPHRAAGQCYAACDVEGDRRCVEVLALALRASISRRVNACPLPSRAPVDRATEPQAMPVTSAAPPPTISPIAARGGRHPPARTGCTGCAVGAVAGTTEAPSKGWGALPL